MKKLFRLAVMLAAAATIVWLTRENLLPRPRVTDDPRPHFRSSPPPPQQDPDDLTEIKGIGNTYAGRLDDMGIQSFRALSEVDPETVAGTVGTSKAIVNGWIAQARAKLS
jgi:predicted flap endonuclease-1-like 5' DNA nuclease